MSRAGAGIRRALISVSDKQGLAGLGKALAAHGVEILSTGGSARVLRDAGLEVIDVSAYTGFPEIMDGRVKTLHPRIHGGILARPDLDDAVLDEHGIAPIDLVVINLYPFADVVARADCSFEEAIENIDIGGPAMLRAAAKNHARVTVVCRPADYPDVIETLPAGPDADARLALAGRAFAHTAAYDGRISQWFGGRDDPGPLPARLDLNLESHAALRYGENPHQAAGVYVAREHRPGGLAGAEVIQGKPLSYNNLLDADAAWRAVSSLGEQPGCVIVKHNNPCGAACAATPEGAWRAALACDPTSAFGGIIAFNRPVDGAAAAAVVEQFAEVVVAPGFRTAARERFAARPNLRLLVPGEPDTDVPELRPIDGGWLAQTRDRFMTGRERFEVCTERAPGAAESRDLEFAWRVVAAVRSNAIVLARNTATVGIGAGQMSRVDAVRIAIMKAGDAGLDSHGAVLASDAFFPFPDGLEAAAEAGVRAVIQPGGSKRDNEVIAAANRHGMAMVLTGQRHFRH